MNAPIAARKPVKLRASAMPTAFKCGGSIQPCDLEAEEVNEAAETGTAAHKCFESLAKIGKIDWENVDNVCDELDGNSEEVRMLCGKAQKIWTKLRESFPCALTEIAVSYEVPSLDVAGVRLTGHIDLVSVVGNQVRILDWKTGRIDANYSHQMKAYLAMVVLAFPELTGGTATIAWVRTGEIENYTMDRAAALRWVAEFERRVVEWDGVFCTGDHCAHCRRFHECEAGNKLARAYVASVAGIDLASMTETVDTMTPDDAISLYNKARIVARLSERALKAIKARTEKETEIVGTESKLYIATEGRREIDPKKAWPILEGMGFTDDDFAACIKMPVTKLEKRVGDLAEKGKAAAAKRDLTQKLELAGAIDITEVFKLEERRI